VTTGQFRFIEAVNWSPDGKHIGFIANTDTSWDNTFLYQIDPDGSHFTQLTQQAVSNTGLMWSPDGKAILLVEATYAVDLAKLDVKTGKIVILTHNTFGEAYGMVWSPDGKHIALSGNTKVGVSDVYQSDIYLIDSNGAHLTVLTKAVNIKDFYAITPTWSSDSKQIAFALDDEGTSMQTSDIYRIDVNGKNLTNLTHNKAGNMMPSWSPDGKQIIFVGLE
jgi:TolB protein